MLTTDILDVALLCIIFFCSLIKFINHVFVLDKKNAIKTEEKKRSNNQKNATNCDTNNER
jgi:hypothetical protein